MKVTRFARPPRPRCTTFTPPPVRPNPRRQSETSLLRRSPLSTKVVFDDWDPFGVKAANVAVLGTLGFPEGTAPDGFAVPFYFYDEFMKHNGFYEDIEKMLADPDFQSDYDSKADELNKLRKKIKKGETPEWVDEALIAMHATYPEGTSLRYRSSTNNEDLPGFNGAGLYDSKTQHPEETEEDGIAKSLKQVYASLWNFRAFVERDFYRIDHQAAAMGVLVHPNYSDEIVNGVAVSTDPAYGTEGTHYVNSQAGEDLVTNPDFHSVPEEGLLNSDGTFRVLRHSNQVPLGQLLMTADQLRQLRRHLDTIHNRFVELYGIEDEEKFAMEVEFKITEDNVLAIKQARPWVFSPLIGRFTNKPAAPHGYDSFIVRIEFSDNVSISEEDFRNHAVMVEGGKIRNARRNGAGGKSWDIEVTPEFDAEVTIALLPDRPCTVEGAICTEDGRRLSNRLELILTQRNLLMGTPLWAGILDLRWTDIREAGAYEIQFFKRSEWTDLPGDGIDVAFYGSGAVIRNLPLTSYLGNIPLNAYAFRVRAITSQGPTEWFNSYKIPSSGGPEDWAGVPEPANSAAMGVPTNSGTLEVGEALSADVSSISDDNGLERVWFYYQWTRDGGTDSTDIEGATGPSYTLSAEDINRSIVAITTSRRSPNSPRV